MARKNQASGELNAYIKRTPHEALRSILVQTMRLSVNI
jgi:hypothetical protein